MVLLADADCVIQWQNEARPLVALNVEAEQRLKILRDSKESKQQRWWLDRQLRGDVAGGGAGGGSLT